MQFKTGNTYRHRSSIDIDIVVTYVEEITGGFRLYVRYWNRHSLHFQGDAEKVFVSYADSENWEKVKGVKYEVVSGF